MKLSYIFTPIKRSASVAEPERQSISVKQLGISKVVVVRTKHNGGL